ncbi:MAG: peptide ABC transporter permease [Comamonadaceae bacterium CG_4_9_14_0_8_um_filter_57_21]|nr:MAG: peptide ABC transporter permease [Comamonadaceae bacterium CG_4_9_14_0_8_um_filter_57_21]
MPKLVFLATDLALYLQLAVIAFYIWHASRTPTLRQTWQHVLHDAAAMSAGVVLLLFVLIAVLDSVHFRPLLPPVPGAAADAGSAYSTRTLSVLDVLLAGPREAREKTYSVPLGTHQFSKESILVDGKSIRDFPRLKFGGGHLKDAYNDRACDITFKSILGLLTGAVVALLAWFLLAFLRVRGTPGGTLASLRAVWNQDTVVPWRAILLMVSVVFLFAGWVGALWPYYHVLGTDQTGNDVLYQALKSIRTAVVIGSLATIATLPLAIVFGILAGYYKGKVDDAIQYLYTVLSSIPSVLLISAFVLMIQVFIDKNPQLFETGLERADIRLFLLAAILGVTGWAGLARLLRAETLKLGELDYVQAARAFGVSDAGIMRRHILPNLTHIVVIVSVLDFSGLVLYEAVLSYVGVGVDPSTNSFGTMINGARNEMSRDPVVWWNLLAAFAFMVSLVLSMTLFASAVREAFDPRARAFRVKRNRPAAAAKNQNGLAASTATGNQNA